MFEAAAFAQEFFMRTSAVHSALHDLADRLEEAGIPYAIIGAMALNEHGYERVTNGVDVLLTRAGLAQFKDRHLGLGYVERSAGSKGMRDTRNGVGIDVILAGEYPRVSIQATGNPSRFDSRTHPMSRSAGGMPGSCP